MLTIYSGVIIFVLVHSRTFVPSPVSGVDRRVFDRFPTRQPLKLDLYGRFVVRIDKLESEKWGIAIHVPAASSEAPS
jgi:hypothetical protein